MSGYSLNKHGALPANKYTWILRIVLMIVLVVIAADIYDRLLADIIDNDRLWFPALLMLWLFSAYIVLPRIHRWLSKLYLPNYFIGRVRTGDGLLGDPVNLAINGTQQQLLSAMKKAGWTRADELNTKSSLKMFASSVGKKSYPTAPVSSLFLFHNKQNVAFQQEVNGNPRQRHHVRFWKTPMGWWLPGGHKATWLGAATFDKHVGFSLFTGQVTHKIEEETDVERDFVVKSLVDAKVTEKTRVVQHFVSGYHDRNGGGDRIITDGSLPFITLKK